MTSSNVFVAPCMMFALAVFGAAPAQAPRLARTLVVDCSASSGVVSRVSLGDKTVRQTTVVEDSKRFVCAPRGCFVYQNRAGRWFRGDCYSGTKAPLAPSAVPPVSAMYPALSNGGDRLSWVEREGKTSRLASADLRSGAMSTVVQSKGWICAHAWSPGDSQIAYYVGPAAVGMGGYSLMVIRSSDDHPKPRQLAPPSQCIYINPVRVNPPSWSPDGTKILIEAAYASSKPSPLRYIVSADTGDMWAAVAGTWREDSKAIFTVISSGDATRGYLYTLGLWPIEGGKGATQALGIKLPRDRCNVTWTHDGEYVAFTRTVSRKLHVLNTRTKEQHKIMACERFSRLHWLSR